MARFAPAMAFSGPGATSGSFSSNQGSLPGIGGGGGGCGGRGVAACGAAACGIVAAGSPGGVIAAAGFPGGGIVAAGSPGGGIVAAGSPGGGIVAGSVLYTSAGWWERSRPQGGATGVLASASWLVALLCAMGEKRGLAQRLADGDDSHPANLVYDGMLLALLNRHILITVYKRTSLRVRARVDIGACCVSIYCVCVRPFPQ